MDEMDVLHESSFAEEDEEKEALLALLLAEDGFTPVEVQTIQVRKETGPVPLSFAQERLWFLDQLMPRLSSYNIPVTLQLKGPLRIEVLARSLNEIVRRHSALRTSFKMLNDQPVQVIAETLDATPGVCDLRSLSPEAKLSKALHLAQQEARQPFDLANGPLFRTRLLWMDEQEFRLLLTMHHIVSDGWSMSVLYRELAALYSAFLQGKPSPLPEPAIQYADFAVWQRSWLQGEVLEEHLGYWREQFRDAPAILKLPTDRPRPAIQTYSGEVEILVLSPSLTTALKNMSQRAEATLFMTLLAAWQHLLWRYSGQDDMCVGTFIANRNRPEIEELIGFFINNLALRTDLSGYPTFWELLKRVRKVTLDAYAHQDIPFEKLLQELGWKHDLSVTPLFQVMLILQNMPEPIPELADISIQETGEWSKRAHFDLALWVTEAQDHLQMGLQYNTDLFDAPTIRRMLSHFRVLLEGIVADPQQRLANLPLFSEQERQSILRLGQTGRSESSGEKCLHQLFEEQVQQTPDTIALVSAQEQLTYAALNRRANQLAHYLRKLGIGPEARVGLCLPRCGEQIIGLLGILKAGGAYIPLDPAYPPERLAFMARDAQLTLLVTLSSLLEHVPASSGQIVCLDTDSHLLDLEPACNPANQTQPLNLAYVIYTSGSTGRPRGVALQHCSVVNFLAAVRNVYALAPGDRLLQFTSISFDISVEEIFASLTSGASLVLRSEAMLSSVPFFLDLCRQWGITILDLPTAFWHEIVAELAEVSEGLPEALRLVIIGGERAQPGRLAVWQRHTSPHRLLINTYGPTEATVVSTLHIIDSSQIPGHEIPIGRPLTDVQIAILDRFQHVVPVGVWGELAIGGKGLARGYLGSPELTAEKFSPDPAGNGTRLYRSGDLARYLPDGTIEFGGRLDDQIKLRGFRVEPGEIEAALHLHPAIHESVVLAFESSPGEKALVAYLVWKNGQVRQIDELRTFLKTLLPEHMIPTAILSLEQLPLQPNGKIDRRALPAPDLAPLQQARKHLIPPRDALEWQLSHIWEECLQLHPIGVTENFFELGGHSLLAVRLLSRIQKHFSRQLPLSALFQGATIEQLAALLRQQTGMPASVLVEMQPRGSKPPLFLMHPTGGNVLCYAALTRSLGGEQPVYALQARGLQSEETPLTEVEEMATLYIQAIRARQPEGPYLLGGWSSGGLLALEVAQQLQAQGQKIALLVLLDTPALFSREPESGASTRSTTAQDEAAILARFVSQLGDNSKDLAGIYADLRQLSPEDQLLFVLQQAKEEGVVPADADLSLMVRLIGVYKADVQATLHYRPQVYPGRITYFQSEHSAQKGGDTLKNWQEIAGGGLDLVVSPGDHFGMLREPHVQVLATQLQVHLTEVLAALELL